MNCPKCNTEIPDGSQACPNCGVQIVAPNDNQVPIAPTSEVSSSQPAVGSSTVDVVQEQLPDVSSLAAIETKVRKPWLAITSLVLGVLGLITWVAPYFGVVFALAGLVLGIMGLKTNKKILAIVGIVLASISLILSFVITGNSIYKMLLKSETPTGRQAVTTSKNWDALLNPATDSRLAKISRYYITAVYGTDNNLPSDTIKSVKDISDTTRDMLDIYLQDGIYLWAVSGKSTELANTAMVLNMDIENNNVSTKFDWNNTANKLIAPTDAFKAKSQKLIDQYSALLPEYSFKKVSEIKFSTSRELADLEVMDGGTYIVRPDGYSELRVGRFDKSGNNPMALWIIFKGNDVMGAGIASFKK